MDVKFHMSNLLKFAFIWRQKLLTEAAGHDYILCSLRVSQREKVDFEYFQLLLYLYVMSSEHINIIVMNVFILN